MIGVVDSGTPTVNDIVTAFSDAGDVQVADAPNLVEDNPKIIIVNNDTVLTTLAQLGIECPILVVDAGPGIGSIPKSNIQQASTQILEGDFETNRHPILTASIDGEPVSSGVFDVMLTTAEAGRISEYGVATTTQIARFRADGIVAATPAGSYRYANAAGGPILDSKLTALAVLPIAPFAIRTDHWVFDLETPINLSVERDENEVVLLLDGDPSRSIPPKTSVCIRHTGYIQTIDPEVSVA